MSKRRVTEAYKNAPFEETLIGEDGRPWQPMHMHDPFPKRYAKAEDWPHNPVFPIFEVVESTHDP